MEKSFNELNKLENTVYFLECICKNKKYIRYEKIAELNEIIGNYYKKNNKSESSKHFINSYKYYVLVYDYYKYDKKNLKYLLLLIAEQLEEINYKLSIEYYTNIIEIYAEKGDIVNVIKYYEIIANLYLINYNLKLSQQIFEKIILICGNNINFELNVKKATENITKITLINMLQLEEIKLQ